MTTVPSTPQPMLIQAPTPVPEGSSRLEGFPGLPALVGLPARGPAALGEIGIRIPVPHPGQFTTRPEAWGGAWSNILQEGQLKFMAGG